MLYTVQDGGTERTILAQLRPHEDIPDRILNAPELFEGSQFFLDAFWNLDSERSLGFGHKGRIYWCSIKEYALTYNLTIEEFDRLVYMITEMDIAYLNYLGEEAKERMEKK